MMPDADGLVWFAVFWAAIATLAAAEWLADRPSHMVQRRTRWPINLALGLVNGVLVSSLPVSGVALALWAEQAGLGLLNRIEVPLVIAVVVTFAARSLAQWVFHYACHHVGFLWRFHRVHHCDDHLDASSGLRFHPLELLASIPFFGAVVVLLGLDLWALVVFELLEISFTLLTHSSLRWPRAVENALRPYLITPALHHIHHSDKPVETDSNFATIFVVWDRMFGTYLREPTRSQEHFRVGLDTVDAKTAHDFGRLIVLPFSRRRQ